MRALVRWAWAKVEEQQQRGVHRRYGQASERRPSSSSRLKVTCMRKGSCRASARQPAS